MYDSCTYAFPGNAAGTSENHSNARKVASRHMAIELMCLESVALRVTSGCSQKACSAKTPVTKTAQHRSGLTAEATFAIKSDDMPGIEFSERPMDLGKNSAGRHIILFNQVDGSVLSSIED